MPDDRPTNPWDRQPLDTEDSWPWFVAYRDTPSPRRLAKLRVAGQVTPPLQTLLQWYNDHCWRDRAAEWDKHLDQLRQEEREEALRAEARDAAAQEATLVRASRELAERELEKMLETSKASEAETLKPSVALKAVEQAVKLTRLTRGESTENVNAAGSIDLSGVPIADIRAIVKKARSPA